MDRLTTKEVTVCACHSHRSMDLATGQFLVARQIERAEMKIDSSRYIKLSLVGARDESHNNNKHNVGTG